MRNQFAFFGIVLGAFPERVPVWFTDMWLGRSMRGFSGPSGAGPARLFDQAPDTVTRFPYRRAIGREDALAPLCFGRFYPGRQFIRPAGVLEFRRARAQVEDQ